MPAFPTRLPAIAAALTATWALNRSLAFQPAPGGRLAEFGRYLLVSFGGACLNLVVYAGVVAGLQASGAQGAGVAALGVAAGSAAAMIFNFLGYRGFAFAARG
ncbi:MAG: GtrA family protein [Rhizobiales bacterium]|nr:GtrA family protein [Hyphomicrobiales bacterium]